MEYAVVLLLLTIARVQGYSNSTEDRIKRDYSYNDISSESSRREDFRRKDFDRIFDHYRSDGRRSREPRFISFNTKDDNIEVEIDFAIPFLSIPVKRSLNGAMGTISNAIKGIPMANVNVGAVILTGVVIVGGAMIGGIARVFGGGNFIEVIGGMPWFRTGNHQKRYKDDETGSEDSGWWRILDQIDRALLKYDFDTTACTQRAICWHVKESQVNMIEKKASNFDQIVTGLSSSDWALQLISNTAWSDAVTAGKQNRNCEAAFKHCKLGSNYLETLTSKLVNFATRK